MFSSFLTYLLVQSIKIVGNIIIQMCIPGNLGKIRIKLFFFLAKDVLRTQIINFFLAPEDEYDNNNNNEYKY